MKTELSQSFVVVSIVRLDTIKDGACGVFWDDFEKILEIVGIAKNRFRDRMADNWELSVVAIARHKNPQQSNGIARNNNPTQSTNKHGRRRKNHQNERHAHQ